MDLLARFRRNAIEFLLNEDKNRAMKFIYDQISNAGMDELPIPLPDLCLLLLEHSGGQRMDRVWEIVETNQQQEEFLITIARDNDRYDTQSARPSPNGIFVQSSSLIAFQSY